MQMGFESFSSQSKAIKKIIEVDSLKFSENQILWLIIIAVLF